MLSPPDERTLVALAALHGDTDWQVVMDWLRRNAKTLVTTMISAHDDVVVRQHQGAAQTLTELLELDETSVEVSHRVRSRKP